MNNFVFKVILFMRHNPKIFRCTTIIHLHYLRLLIQHCFEYLLICDCHIKKLSFRNFSLVNFPPLPENQLPFLRHLFEHQFIWVLFPESYNTAVLLVQSFQVRSTYAELLVIPIFRIANNRHQLLQIEAFAHWKLS